MGAEGHELPVDKVVGKARERTEKRPRGHHGHVRRVGQGAELWQVRELQIRHAAMQDRVHQFPAGGDKDRAIAAGRRRFAAAPVKAKLGMRRLGQRHVNMREQLGEPGVDPAPGWQAGSPGHCIGRVLAVFRLRLEPFVRGV